MAARAAVIKLQAEDEQMQLLGITADRIFGSNSTDTPVRNGLFSVHKWAENTKRGGLTTYTVSIWFHMPKDREKDYGKIDLAILRMKELMKEAEHVVGADGWVLVAASWISDSPDYPDDGYNTLTRYTQFRCACRNIE